eukprot:GHVT01096574.1.p1 GENE.GHVT01096574.1~~GHVT01096574.1.p1  ORF type:complete len:248 (+),score=45.83 GHVT01096574.1:131-874(+)
MKRSKAEGADTRARQRGGGVATGKTFFEKSNGNKKRKLQSPSNDTSSSSGYECSLSGVSALAAVDLGAPSVCPPPCLVTPVIQNVIASVHLGCPDIDLRCVAVATRHVEYNPRKVNALVIRLRHPKCTGLIFRSGRLMITGARSEADARLGGKIMARLVQRVNHPDVRFVNFRVENITATADCQVPVRLEGLANDHKEFCSYEPEIFAGMHRIRYTGIHGRCTRIRTLYAFKFGNNECTSAIATRCR